MSPKDFISSIQDYYGMAYTPGEAKVIGPWISAQKSEFLDELFNLVVRSHTRSLRCLPDMAIFAQNEGKALDSLQKNRQVIKKTPVKALLEEIAADSNGDLALEGLVQMVTKLSTRGRAS